MRRLLREPLLHFLLLGAALFAVISILSGRARQEDNSIVVPAARIDQLADLFGRTWQRPPTRPELERLVDDFIREEVAYREAAAIGLDREDTVIRRHMRRKLDFIAETLVSQAEPAEGELAAYLRAHPDDFRVDPRLSFRHVYLDPGRRGDDIDADARALLGALNDDATLDAAVLGDPIMLEPGYADLSMREVAGLFGTDFATAVIELEPGAWHGPIRSGYGAHLVRIDRRTEGRLPELTEVRDAVRRDWSNARRQEVIEKFYRGMLDRYEVVIEWPDGT